MSVVPLTRADRPPSSPFRLVGGLTLLCVFATAALLFWQFTFAQADPKAKPTTPAPDAGAQKAAEVSARAADLHKRLTNDKSLPDAARAEYTKDSAWLAEQSKDVAKLADLSARLGDIEAKLQAADEREKQRFEALEKKLGGGPAAGPRRACDVLVLALHSADLSVARVRGPLKAQFEPRAVADRPPGTRVGLMVAVGAEVQKDRLIAFADAKPDPAKLDGLGAKPNGVAEQLADLGADVLNQFDSSAKTARRVLVVASDRAAPPTGKPWDGLQVDALLVADGRKPDADKLLAWHQFTAAHSGGVAVVQFGTDGQDDPVFAQMETHLGRFLQFTPVGGK